MTTHTKLQELFGVDLLIDLDSAQGDYPDEEFGNFFQCSVSPNPIPDQEPPIVVIYYDQDLVQLWHDATPYPTAANTAREERDMMMCLIHHPVRPDQITKDDFDNFINRVILLYKF